MLIGYARVSTTDQTLVLQQDALTEAGCEKIFTDTASGSLAERSGLAEALTFARSGDTLVVWRLDRLGRSLQHLIDTVATLKEHGIHFLSLQEQIDTATSGGKLVFHLFGALAEFERDLIRERTAAGLKAARARGQVGGRPRVEALNTPQKVRMARALYQDKHNSVTDICRQLRISRTTLYRYMRDALILQDPLERSCEVLCPGSSSFSGFFDSTRICSAQVCCLASCRLMTCEAAPKAVGRHRDVGVMETLIDYVT